MSFYSVGVKVDLIADWHIYEYTVTFFIKISIGILQRVENILLFVSTMFITSCQIFFVCLQITK